MARVWGNDGWGLLTGITAIAVFVYGTLGATLGEKATAAESHILWEAERELEQGEFSAAAALYQEAFEAAASFEERVGLIGPLARAFFLNQELEALLGEVFPFVGDRVEPWEVAVFRGAVFQFVEDLSAAGAELSALAQEEVPDDLWGQFLQQRRVWAEDIGDLSSKLFLSREVYAEEPSVENRASYLRAVLEAGEEEELLAHLQANSNELNSEAAFWRSFLPELREFEVLDAVSARLEEAWQQGGDDAEVLFALAELRVFQNRIEEAVELFWTVFEMEELARPVDGMPYFQRLNHFFHNRFAVKNRIGQATGRYGTQSCREFSFLGMRQDVDVADTESARDAALLYLRELLVPAGSSADFLRRLRSGLDRENRPPAQRILAFAGVGAPAWMLEEIEAFVNSPADDSAAAEFSLLAMNRFVLSTDKFPELRLPMRDLARALEGKFRAGRSAVMRQRNQEMQNRILSRLGFDLADAEGLEEQEKRKAAVAAIVEAIQAGDPAEAERVYREEDGMGDEDLRNLLLFLARAWQAQGVPEKSAARVAEFLEPFYPRAGGEGVAAPLEWPFSAAFPPPNPYFDEADLEALRAAYKIVAGTSAWGALQENLAVQIQTLPEGSQAGAIFARAVLHWWAEEPDEAIAVARSGAEELGDPEIQLLLAHLLGMEERFGEGAEVLEEISPTAAGGAGERALRLSFAFAVADRDHDQSAARARDLEDLPLNAAENLQVASGLSSLGLQSQAANWLEKVPVDELGSGEEDTYRSVHLKVLVDQQKYGRAAAKARFILFGDVPSSFHSLMTAVRIEALEILVRTGEMGDYQRQLRELLALVPESLSLHLLLGESADFLWQETERDGQHESAEAREEAIRAFSQAVTFRPEFADLRVELCEWMAERELWNEGVTQYEKLLEYDAQTALLELQTLFRVYREAQRLPLLVDFLEEWQVPEASSMDDFYGVQPTAHIFHPLGRILVEEGERDAAVRAWTKGLEINPIGFTEEMRVELAELFLEEGRMTEVLELLKGYVAERNLDPHLYATQPFATVVPRWVAPLQTVRERSTTPVERLLSMVEEGGRENDLRVAVQAWRNEMPERVSLAVFSVYLSARAGVPGWREQLAELGEPYSTFDFGL